MVVKGKNTKKKIDSSVLWPLNGFMYLYATEDM